MLRPRGLRASLASSLLLLFAQGLCRRLHWPSGCRRTVVFVPWLCLWLLACGGVSRDLSAANALYADARYEAVQAWLGQLQHERADMSAAQLAQFHYLSGMTAYRMSQSGEALHELALAAHAAREQPSALRSDQLALLYRTLEELADSRVSAPH